MKEVMDNCDEDGVQLGRRVWREVFSMLRYVNFWADLLRYCLQSKTFWSF